MQVPPLGARHPLALVCEPHYDVNDEVTQRERQRHWWRWPFAIESKYRRHGFTADEWTYGNEEGGS